MARSRKAQEGSELLAPVYGWFTEGFDTLYLKEAQAFLDDLANLFPKKPELLRRLFRSSALGAVLGRSDKASLQRGLRHPTA